ncbi:MAG: hypothetical protein ABI665_03855 [Vicinamibacterales bacterium]
MMLGLGNKPGSWQIRGQQLGAALDARATSTPNDADWRWADLAVLVKRSEPRFGPDARAAGVPIVWDALDCWRQPTDNGCTEAASRKILQAHQQAIKPALTIGATQAQAEAAGGVYLPHHSWPGLEPTSPRERVTTVAYQGNAAYLGNWLARVSLACGARGWQFVVNPRDLRDADILVAFRDGSWDGWMCREWKSGVKLVNALAAGRPIITQISAAAREITAAPVVLCDEGVTLDAALDMAAPLSMRQQVFEHCVAHAGAYRLPAVAARYREILATMRTACPA